MTALQNRIGPIFVGLLGIVALTRNCQQRLLEGQPQGYGLSLGILGILICAHSFTQEDPKSRRWLWGAYFAITGFDIALALATSGLASGWVLILTLAVVVSISAVSLARASKRAMRPSS